MNILVLGILFVFGILLGSFILPFLMLFIKPRYLSVDDQSPSRTVLQDVHTLATHDGRLFLFGVDVTKRFNDKAEDVIKEITNKTRR